MRAGSAVIRDSDPKGFLEKLDKLRDELKERDMRDIEVDFAAVGYSSGTQIAHVALVTWWDRTP